MAPRQRIESLSEPGPGDLIGAEILEFDVEVSEPDSPVDLTASIHGVVQRSLEQAIQFYEENLEPDQTEATDYYYGRPFGDEEEGRSKVVSTDVRDAVKAQLASLLRIFFSADHTVEFRARGVEDEPIAQQQTEYIRYVISEDNEGFLVLHSAFKDALVRRTGVVKWWRDEAVRTSTDRWQNLSEPQVAFMQSDPSVSLTIDSVRQDPSLGVSLYDVTVTHTETQGRDRIAAVPPEEFVYTPNARDLDTAPLVAHVREVPASELIAMGIDRDAVEAAAGKARAASSDDLGVARTFHDTETDFVSGEEDESQTPVLFAEAYVLVDADEDGISERRLFQCIGPDFEVVNGLGEPVDDVPFAVFTPDPEPHTIVGLSTFDYLKDVQRVKSQVLRATLNSLALAVEPQLEVVMGEVNMQDLLNPEVSGIVRVRRPGMLREVKHSFVGTDTLPVLSYYDEIKENRTGISKAAAGLDADSLQSSTKAAVAATLSGAQQHIELIARVFAETGMKRLFRGLLRQTVKHQDRARVIRLNGKYVEIDPRAWDSSRDVTINVGLGQGTPEDRIAALQSILAIQRELMMSGAPIVSMVEIRKTLAKAVELAGFKNADEFFKPWGPEEEQAAAQQAAQQPPPPDPTQMMMQIEQQKLQLQQMEAQARLQLEQQKAVWQNDRERDKMAREMALREYEIELKYNAQINDAQLRAQVAADRAAMDADIRAQQALTQGQTQETS